MVQRFVLLLGIALCSLNVQSATLVQYSFGVDSDGDGTGDAGTKTLAATTLIAGASASSITDGPSATVGIQADEDTGLAIDNNGSSSASFNILQATGFGEIGANIGNTASQSDYFQFTLTPDNAFDLETVFLDVANGSSSADRRFQLRYSYDNFASSDNVAGTSGFLQVFDGDGLQFNRFTYGLSDEDAINDLTDSTVTFRILGASGSEAGQIRFDNITVTGAVIPEPSTFALVISAVTALMLLRRRR